ncbi:MAG: methyltransferase domain-containing protein [Antricoccus sp.]
MQRGIGAAFLDSLDLERPRSILDVGCGDGFLTEQLAQRSRVDVLGVDAAPAMIARAAQRSTGHLRFAEADAATMAFDERFDLIVSLNTLHWVLDVDAAFARLFAAQAPNSMLVCQLVGATEVDSVEDVSTYLTESADWRPYFGDGFQRPYVHPTAVELQRVAESSGYRRVKTATWDEVFTFGSAEHFGRWLAAGSRVWTDRLPQDRRELFVREVVERYARVCGSTSDLHFGQLRLTAERAD